MDGVISQSDKSYLEALLNYSKILAQRNALLKYFALNNNFNKDSLDVYNEQLNEYGDQIYSKRKTFLEAFTPIFKKRYEAISNNSEVVDLQYSSQLNDSTLMELFATSINKDRMLQYTSVGIHKDDLDFSIKGYPIKKFGSQGQQKSFLIALKLAQFDFIKAQSGETPLLLLDDVFDKLDEQRVAQIIQLVNDENFGQLFISDTHADRTEKAIKSVHQSYQIFQL